MLEFDEIAFSDQLDNEFRDLLHDIVSWRNPPTFREIGRSSWISLAAPLHIDTPMGLLQIHSLKIKGAGLCDHMHNVLPPSVTPFYRSQLHMGIREDGAFFTAKSPPSPLGGILADRARAEFEIADALLKNNCLSQVPLMLCRYRSDDLRFDPGNGERHSMGVVVSGLVTHTAIRGTAVLNSSKLDEAETAELARWKQRLRITDTQDQVLVTLERLQHLYGRSLRHFHEAGFYRYSGGLGNYGYCDARNTTFMIDLDSSRRLEECNALQAPLQLMRDVASSIYHMAGRFLRRENINQFTVAKLQAVSPIESFLKGYYHEVDPSRIKAVANEYLKY